MINVIKKNLCHENIVHVDIHTQSHFTSFPADVSVESRNRVLIRENGCRSSSRAKLFHRQWHDIGNCHRTQSVTDFFIYLFCHLLCEEAVSFTHTIL